MKDFGYSTADALRGMKRISALLRGLSESKPKVQAGPKPRLPAPNKPQSGGPWGVG